MFASPVEPSSSGRGLLLGIVDLDGLASSSSDRGLLLGNVDLDGPASASRFFGEDLDTGGAKAAVKVGLNKGIFEGDADRVLTGWGAVNVNGREPESGIASCIALLFFACDRDNALDDGGWNTEG